MNQGKMVFAQIMEFAPFHVFKYCVRRYNGDYRTRDFTCWKQFLCMSFGQLTHRESISDTALCLNLQKEKLYQLGIGFPFHKSSISRANETRDWRIFRYFDVETQRTLVFLTNNFKLTATTIAALYKSRWGIETFFKWIKQHLKIQSFWGQSENAVKTQILIAISSYLIVIIAKKQLKLKYSLYEILQMISLAPFDRTPMRKLFENAEYQDVKEQKYNQLKLF